MISLGLSDFETNDDSQPPPDLLRALGETVAWCTRHLLDSDRLRSQELDPNSFLSIPALGDQEIRAFIKEKRDSYRRAMESINRKRSEILHRATIQPVDLAEAQALGRFLLYEFMETVSDGSSEALSDGFFDMEDAPPRGYMVLAEGRHDFLLDSGFACVKCPGRHRCESSGLHSLGGVVSAVAIDQLVIDRR